MFIPQQRRKGSSPWQSWPAWGLIGFTLALAGCGRDAAPTAAGTTTQPLDARKASVYERACMACHEAPGSGAPLRGDHAAWAARRANGPSALVASVRQGKGAMPPMGWCPECTDEDFAMLINHLASPAPAR
jgi:cytochrome c5